jgi:DNA modification methylase
MPSTIHWIPHDTVIVRQDRQRKSMDEKKLKALMDSIKHFGLIHPIVVESLEEPYLLVGERRLLAMRKLESEILCANELGPLGCVPVLLRSDVDDQLRQEIEYTENIAREDLSWQDRVAAEARLHKFRVKQADTVGTVQTLTDTAREIKGDSFNTAAITDLRENVMLEPYLQDDDVKGAKTRREAVNIVKKKLTDIFRGALAKRMDLNRVNKPHRLICGSCLDYLPLLCVEPTRYDVILVDPPYGINAHKMTPMSQSESGMMHEYEDSPESAKKIWECIANFGAQVCKPEAHLYMFLDFRHWETVKLILTYAGWVVWPTPIIWHKPTGGMLGDSTRGPRKSYEMIIYATRGDKRVKGVYFDTIIANPADASLHAAAKPVEVLENLLRRSCNPGDRVLDPCCGSGPIFDAADRLSLIATGIEISERHHATALTRIAR